VLAIAAHAVVLALPARPAAHTRGGAERPDALHVRVVSSAPAATVDAIPSQQGRDALPNPAPLERGVSAEPIARAAPSPLLHAEPHDEPRSSSGATKASAAEAVDDLGPVVRGAPDGIDIVVDSTAWALARVATADDAFVARTLLSVAPHPLEPVIVPVPDFVRAGEIHRGELTLFIDETGTVVQVRPESDTLPDALIDVARRAFMAVRFAPGELTDLGAVKSRIRIEVVFDGGAGQGPLPKMPASNES
jgi:hypothetical protein